MTLLAVTVAAAFASVTGHDFVDLDDYFYVKENPMVSRGLTPEGLAWAFGTDHASNWHPLTWMSHMLDVSLFGVTPSGPHLVNLLIHLGNTVLLYAGLFLMTGLWGRSFLVAALFGLHPLHVESVAWVSERKDVLSAFFFLWSILAYVWYARRPRMPRLLLTLGLFLMALLSKPMTVTLPLVLLLLDFWPLDRFRRKEASPAAGSSRAISGRLKPRAGVRTEEPARAWWGPAAEKLPFFILSAVSAVITLGAQRQGGSVVGVDELPLLPRLANAFHSYAGYLWKMIWPLHLAVFYPHLGKNLPLWKGATSGILLVLLTVGALRCLPRRRYLLVGWLWYLATLLPVIGLVQVGYQAMADRYTYLPLIGPFIILAWGGAEAAEKLGRMRVIAPVTATAILAVLSILTMRQAGTWRNSRLLFTHAIESAPGNWTAHHYLGVVSYHQRDRGRAVEEFRKAIAIRPDLVLTRYNLGVTYQELGRWEEAVGSLAEAARLDPSSATTLMRLGALYEQLGRLAEAAEAYERAIDADPRSGQSYLKLGTIYRRRGDMASALRVLDELRRVDPSLAGILERGLH